MGYTHYWYRETEIPAKEYLNIAMDFQKLVPIFTENGVNLKGGSGEGELEISEGGIFFNGDSNCGHTQFDLGITWPAKKATGVANGDPAISGGWFAGATLEKRSCGGDCSHEPMCFPVRFQPEKWMEQHSGKWFEFCKTAFKPYDWAVTAFLVIAKHYLGDKLLVHSDGDIENWYDAMQLCQIELGYGLGFKLDRSED